MQVNRRLLWTIILASGLSAAKTRGQIIVDSIHIQNVELTMKVLSIDEINQLLRTSDTKGSLGVYVYLDKAFFNQEVQKFSTTLPVNIWYTVNLFENNIQFYMTIETIEKHDRATLFSFTTCCYGPNFSGKVKFVKDEGEWKVKNYDIEQPARK